MKPSALSIILALFSAGIVTAQTNPVISGDELLIYAFAENHTLTANGNLSTDGDLSHLPQITLADDGFNLSVTFTPRKTGLSYTVQYSTDLQTWTDVPTAITQLNEPHPFTTNLAAAPANNRLFARVKVTVTDILAIDIDNDGLPDAWEKHYFGSILNITATSTLPNLDNLTALDAYRNNLDPALPLESQSTETYTYDAKAQLLSKQISSVTITYGYDADGNINPVQ